MLDTYTPSVLQERPNPISEDDRALWCAVMERAVDDLRCVSDHEDKDGANNKRLRYEDAKRWFESESTFVTSFLFCCDVLGFDPSRIRNKLFAEKKTLVATQSFPRKRESSYLTQRRFLCSGRARSKAVNRNASAKAYAAATTTNGDVAMKTWSE